MKTLFKVGLSLFIVSGCFADTSVKSIKKVVPYNYYGYKSSQKQIMNIKIIIKSQETSTNLLVKKVNNCQLDDLAPIAPYIDNY